VPLVEGGGDPDRDGDRLAAGGVVDLYGRSVAFDRDAEDLVSHQRLRGFLHGAVQAHGQDDVDEAVPGERVHLVHLLGPGLTFSVAYGDRAVLRVGGGRLHPRPQLFGEVFGELEKIGGGGGRLSGQCRRSGSRAAVAAATVSKVGRA
jgi:hypothetical protein